MSKNSNIARMIRSFEQTDAMPAGLRKCVHEYGFAIVNACIMAGVKEPSRVHLLVREIWEGARQPRQTRNRGGTLDWLLLQAGAQISAAELARVLQNNNLAIVSMEPTSQMVAASMSEVSGGNELMTKREKHRRRLAAALRADSKYRPKESA